LTLAELAKKHGVHSGQISTWKRAALDNMASAFTKRGSDPGPEISTAEVEKLHSKSIRPVKARFQAFSGCQFHGMSSSRRLIL